MQLVNVEVIEKADVEDFACKEVELVKAFIVKNGMQSGLPSVILRLTDGKDWFEADVTGQIIAVVGHMTQEIIDEIRKGELQ